MQPSPRALVGRFYGEVWNQADAAVAAEILSPDFCFRASLGPERRGVDGFVAYMRDIHAALADYICVIDELLEDGPRAVARMTFTGRHHGRFFDVAPTGRTITWAGAAFFTTQDGRITALWVLGDIDSVKRQLGAASGKGFSEPGD